VFTQEAATTVQVTALLTQFDPRLNQDAAAPYKEHRGGIGLLAMAMGKGKVRKNEKVANFEPNKQMAMRTIRPFRTAVISFNAPPGKYSIIPLTDKDMTGQRY